MGRAEQAQGNAPPKSEIMGHHRFQGVDGTHCFFNLKVIFEPCQTGFEESKGFEASKRFNYCWQI